MISYDDLINSDLAYIKQMSDAYVTKHGSMPADTDYAAFCIDILRSGISVERSFQDRFGITPQNNRTLHRLHVEGRRFVDAHGSDIFLIGTDSWCLFSRFANGENIDAVMDEIRDAGCNALATFSMADGVEMQTGITHNPATDPDHFYKVKDFNAKAAARGLYVYWICFATGQKFYPNVSDANAYWMAFWRSLLGSENTLASLVNEGNQHINIPGDRASYERPSGIVACIGSDGAESPCYLPGWDFSDYHGRRDTHVKMIADADLEELIVGYSGYAGTQMASFQGEGPHFAEVAEPGRRENNPDFAAQLAKASRPTAGFWFLSDDTLRGQLLGPTQKACLLKSTQALLQGC